MAKTTKKKTGIRKVSAAAKIDSIYSALITRLEKAEKFTLEHAPDVCKEIVESKIVMYQNRAINNALTLILTLIGVGIGSALIYKGTLVDKLCTEHCISVELFYVFGGVLFFMSLVGSVINISCTIDALLEIREIKVSKKLTVLRGLKNLIRRR